MLPRRVAGDAGTEEREEAASRAAHLAEVAKVGRHHLWHRQARIRQTAELGDAIDVTMTG